MKKFYITTPIYYINAEPHIGHAYTTIAADVLARFWRQKGVPVHFLTGTDEHGLKIESAAKAAGLSPKDYADRISEKFRELWRHLDISHDDFIRTTEPRHERVVQATFAALLKSGDIYKGRYRGYYCVSDETYWTEKEIAAGAAKLCPNAECRRELELIEEDSYFFRLSKYQKPLLDHCRSRPDFLSPSGRAPEILSFIESGLHDVSVSRDKVQWGVLVPGGESRTVYVWFDALLNYLSAAESAGGDIWPADVHIVGKEIYRFHAAIWPAMLMALGRPLPKKVFAHGWWTIEGDKMSKSRGNFVDPYEITREFGVDALRYFLLREIPFGQDGDFSRQALKRRYNADLANDLGNLVSRVVEMVDRFLGGRLPRQADSSADGYVRRWDPTIAGVSAAVENLDFSRALTLIWSAVSELNRYANEQAPWKTQKTDPVKTQETLFNLVRSLRILMGLIEPFMPQTAAKAQAQLGVRGIPRPLSAEEALAGAAPQLSAVLKAPPLFPRKP